MGDMLSLHHYDDLAGATYNRLQSVMAAHLCIMAAHCATITCVSVVGVVVTFIMPQSKQELISITTTR